MRIVLTLVFITTISLTKAQDSVVPCDTVYQTQGGGGKLRIIYSKQSADTTEWNRSEYLRKFRSDVQVIGTILIENCAQPEQLEEVFALFKHNKGKKIKEYIGVVVTYKKSLTLQDIALLANTNLIKLRVYVDLPLNELIFYTKQ